MQKNHGFSSITLIIIAVLILGGGYWLWKKELRIPDKSNPVVDTNVELSTNSNGNPSTPSVDMVSWKTYRNEEYGFEFQYPGDWESCPIYIDHITGTKNLVCFKDTFSSSKLLVLTEMKEHKNIPTLSELKKYYDNYSRLLVEERDLDQFKFLTVGNCIGGCSYSNYVFLPSGRIIDFHFIDFVEHDRINDDIISTFRFKK